MGGWWAVVAVVAVVEVVVVVVVVAVVLPDSLAGVGRFVMLPVVRRREKEVH